MTLVEDRRYQLYKDYIFDIALDVSQSAYWRNVLFSSNYGQKFLINSDSEFHSPKHTKPMVSKYNLQFYVSKVLKCPISYFMKDGYVIFKFESVEFPEIVDYTGN